jgi:hypothetical protein
MATFGITAGENALLKFALVDLPSNLTWKGAWKSTTAYIAHDAVSKDDAAYKCILANTNNSPPNATYWTLLNTAIAATDITSILVELIDQNGRILTNWSYKTAGSIITSGTLVASTRYTITNFVSGDNFTNVGAPSNATGITFTATGTTPANWSHGSSLQQIDAPINLDLIDGLLELELLAANTANLSGDFEIRISIAKIDTDYIGSGSNTSVLCLNPAITVTPC